MSSITGLAGLCAATNLLTVEQTVEQMSTEEKGPATFYSTWSPSEKWVPAFSSATACSALSSASMPTNYTIPKPHEPAAPEPKQQPKLRMPNKKKKKGYPYAKFER